MLDFLSNYTSASQYRLSLFWLIESFPFCFVGYIPSPFFWIYKRILTLLDSSCSPSLSWMLCQLQIFNKQLRNVSFLFFPAKCVSHNNKRAGLVADLITTSAAVRSDWSVNKPGLWNFGLFTHLKGAELMGRKRAKLETREEEAGRLKTSPWARLWHVRSETSSDPSKRSHKKTNKKLVQWTSQHGQ